MYIKEVIVSGVKSYKEKSSVEFTPGVNLIIGRNGAGKSNLLSAIELVLMKDSEFPKGKDCLLLMHGNKPGQETFVEVVFDNSDRMLPFDSDTVTFRRVIGIKKIQLLINGKEAPQLQSVLQSSGFLNPFFFVRQGRINDIATCTDEYRLQLIKKFVGHELWDEKSAIISKRLESFVKIAGGVRSDLVESLVEMMRLIQKEVEQLKMFNKLKKKSDAIEYALLAKQHENFNNKIQDLEREKVLLVRQMKVRKDKLNKEEENIANVEKKITKVKKHVKDKEEYKIETENKLEDLIKLKASFENSLSAVKSAKSEKQHHLSEIEKWKREINAMKPELLTTEEELKEIKEKENNLVIEITKCEDQIQKLNPKQTPLESQAEIENRKRATLNDINELNSTLAEIKREIRNYALEIEKLTNERKDNVHNLETLSRTNLELEQKLGTLKEEQRSNWNLQSQLERGSAVIGEQVEELKDSLRKLAGKSVVDGINGMRTVLENLKNLGTPEAVEAVNGYHGLLCENINPDPNLRIAVQVAAGKKLFYHVVKTKEIGKVFMREFNRLKLKGEVFFLPEVDVFIPNVTMVQPERNYSSLLSQVNGNPAVERAVKFVFQKYLLCRTMEIACQISKSRRYNCVTLDGDKCLDTGVIQGGYFQQKNTALEIYTSLKALEEEQQQTLNERRDCNSKADKLAKEISKDTSDLNARENTISNIKLNLGKINLQQEVLMEKQNIANQQKHKTEDRLENLQTAIAILDAHLESFKANGNEKSSKRERIDKYKQVKSKLHKLNSENKTCFKKRLELEKKKENLETGIRLRQTLITNKQNTLLSSSDPKVSQEVRNEIETLGNKIFECNNMLRQITKDLEMFENTITKYKVSYNESFEAKVKLEDELNSMTVKHHGNVLKSNNLAEKKSTISIKMQSLDPSSAVNNRYLNSSKQELTRRFGILAHDLKKNPALNQEAELQLQDLEAHLTRKTDALKLFEKRSQTLAEVVHRIELTKAKAVLDTCHQLQQNFRELFSQLVGTGGYAKLVVYGKDTPSEIHETTVYTEPNVCKLWVEGKYTAAKINATFKRGWTAATLSDTRSLSGGQKTLIALAFILALQKCEPSALYLFDEVDQALDMTNRRAIGQILQEQAEESQFICTTFRKELVEIADKVHGVSFINKTSVVKELSRQDALTLIRKNQRPESDRESEENESDNP